MAHPATGPITPEEMARIAALPYGKAGEALRRHDPAWGLATVDRPLIKWGVTLTGTVDVSAWVEVEAPDETKAKEIALGMRISSSDWDRISNPDDIEVESVEPA